MKTSFTEDMRNMREKLNYTQKDLADSLNIPRTVISMIENGKRIPTRRQFKLLDKYLGFTQISTAESLIDEISDLIHDLDIFELLQVTVFIKNKIWQNTLTRYNNNRLPTQVLQWLYSAPPLFWFGSL